MTSTTYGGESLIVGTSLSQVRNAPVYVNSCNLTREISCEEDARLSQSVVVNEAHVDEIFDVLFSACPPTAVTNADRAKVVLCRLLLGPVAVPCYCDEWDADEYTARCAYECTGPVLYVHRGRCRCLAPVAADGGVEAGISTVSNARQPMRFSLMQGHAATHVYRGLLSLTEWNVGLKNLFCECTVFKSDRYVMAVLPERYCLFLDYYPYMLRHICRFITVPEIDDCTNAMLLHLGAQIAARINVHYKLMFGSADRVARHCTPRSLEANRDMFLLELQKLWLGLSYHNDVTLDFFEKIFQKFNEDKGKVMLMLRLPFKNNPTLTRFCMMRFKKQVLYFRLTVKYGKNRKDVERGSFIYKKNVVTFTERDIIWRNLFTVYYGLCFFDDDGASGVASGATVKPALSIQKPAYPHGASARSNATSNNLSAKDSAGQVLPRSGDVATERYVRIINRLSTVRFRECVAAAAAPDRVNHADGGFDFSGSAIINRYRSMISWCERLENRHDPSGVRIVLGGREFSEMTAVTANRVTINAFNTNRVINLKASLAVEPRSKLGRSPKSMTHSFVMYKHTFKEPACTVSTFVSNDAAYTNSLNVNIRGSYMEFLYALDVYKLYVDIDTFFLPACVCNSNSSLDVHGLEDQTVIRSDRNKVYWTTNFPCMISTTDNVNVGWFKAATAIIPKVSGRALENIMLKEISHICEMRDVYVDYGLHRIFTTMETRNSYQVPFLSKQFLLFLRAALIRLHGPEKVLYIDRILFRVIREGLFDYNKEVVAHTKIKHTCALVGTRLANNVPKVLVRNKKIKLDHLGRNANILTFCRHVDTGRISANRLRILIDILRSLAEISFAKRTKEAILRVLAKLTVAAGSQANATSGVARGFAAKKT
ncbi:B87 [miniopterid betaherpesvirus 1]|uniref:B87 n=1 Tax=miniopterid betaherpesvirus 1 TaxID=3070189 RepID=I3VQ80_9BETA|nr:B87 [miniopterid betaherpesvirus 1]AFK83924.1 B87 [miniopterid betaherpesvirus 1]